MAVFRRNKPRRGVTVFLVSGAVLLCCFLLNGCMTTPWDHEQAGIHMKLGMANIESNNYNPALKELLEAEKFTPDDPRIHYYLGMAYYGKGYGDKAIEECKKAIELKPDYSEAHNYLGILYSGKKQWENAIASFQQALTNILYDTPAVALYNMGWAYDQKGDHATAMAKYREALVREPNTVLRPMIEKNMGLSSMALNQIDDAIQYFKRAIAAVPNFIEARYWLAECLLKQNNGEEAKRLLQTVIADAPASDFANRAKKKLNDLK